MEKIVSAHQPNFLPYLGFFDKMDKSDVFVIRDEVQFAERDYHHRNRIRINGPRNNEPQCKWIRVPVTHQVVDGSTPTRRLRVEVWTTSTSQVWITNAQLEQNPIETPFIVGQSS